MRPSPLINGMIDRPFYLSQNPTIIKKIGISVYSPRELSFCFDMMEFDLVQFPMNVFDNRFLKTGWLDRLKKNNIETHARSIFLQGVITLNKWPNYFNIWNKLQHIS